MTRPVDGAAAAILDPRGRLLVVRENYGRRRYGLPGGAVEAGESALDAAVRETREETGALVHVDDVVGVYRLVSGLAVTVFRCSIRAGTPMIPDSGEIAEVGWFAPGDIPEPRTNLLHHSIADIVAERRGVVRDGLPRIN